MRGLSCVVPGGPRKKPRRSRKLLRVWDPRAGPGAGRRQGGSWTPPQWSACRRRPVQRRSERTTAAPPGLRPPAAPGPGHGACRPPPLGLWVGRGLSLWRAESGNRPGSGQACVLPRPSWPRPSRPRPLRATPPATPLLARQAPPPPRPVLARTSGPWWHSGNV
ncbi:basic proline-rich protein-like [Lagenorhynchus albirostris]|uniref:basic proline-rich protein-like n=1 Tax=Lagenorhynchus albirostris TaxID=27610 RepID=UPI0028F12021|nr:basic proline-rich protein-like [Lagenorhynchus albirostris]